MREFLIAACIVALVVLFVVALALCMGVVRTITTPGLITVSYQVYGALPVLGAVTVLLVVAINALRGRRNP